MVKKFSLIILVLITFFAWNISFAEVRPGYFEAGGHLGIYSFHSHQDIDNGFLLGATFGYNFTKNIGIEGILDYINTQGSKVNVDVNGYTYRAEGLYHFLPDRQIVPFVALGVGGIFLDYDTGGSDSGALFDWGGGVKYALNDSVLLRGDVRHYLTFDQAYSNLSFTIGAAYRFSRVRKAPGGDEDSDGVINKNDSCPYTPEGLSVDARGCPLPIEEAVTLSLEMKFAKNSDAIKPIYFPFLDRVARFLSHHPATKASIEGHTDSRGKASYNLKLSRKRAASVARYLIKKLGVDPRRISAVGYGEKKPVADNKTSAGREENRRVIIIISK